MAFPTHIELDLSRNIGPIFISTFISLAVWGILYLQTIIYFSLYKFDNWGLKSFVVILLVINTVEQALGIGVLWRFLIPTQFGDPVAFTQLSWESISQGPISGFLVALAQSFFTWRIWHFSNKNRIVLIIAVPMISGQFIGGLVCMAKQVGKPVSYTGTSEFTNFILGLAVVDAVIDILIASAMCTMLWRGRTGIYLTDRLLVRLMHAAVATSLCTVIFALISAIGIIGWPHDLFYILGNVPFSTLYCNSVLANLNSRKYMKDTDTIVDLFTGRSFHVNMSSPRPPFPTVVAGERNSAINMANVSMEGNIGKASGIAAGGVLVEDGTPCNMTLATLTPHKSIGTRSVC